MNISNAHKTGKCLLGKNSKSRLAAAAGQENWEKVKFLVRKKCMPEEYLSNNLDEHCLEVMGVRRRRGFSRTAARHKVTTKFREICFPFSFFSFFLLAAAARRAKHRVATVATVASQVGHMSTCGRRKWGKWKNLEKNSTKIVGKRQTGMNQKWTSEEHPITEHL